MLIWSLQITISSIILIWLVHYLFNYFKDTLTVPKIKDLVNEPNKKYKNIYQVIHGDQDRSNATSTPITSIMRETLLPDTATSNNPYSYALKSNDDMKSELKNFLKRQINK